jgi:hypothetical protein
VCSINLYKKLWPNLELFASSRSPVCLCINMHKTLFLIFMHSNLGSHECAPVERGLGWSWLPTLARGLRRKWLHQGEGGADSTAWTEGRAAGGAWWLQKNADMSPLQSMALMRRSGA